MEWDVVLTAAERVLLHLLPFWNVRDGAPALTQEGIAERTGLLRSHVPRSLKRLVAEAHIEVREGRLRGRGGSRPARAPLAGVEGESVMFGERRVTVRDLAQELRITPLEVIVGLDGERRYRPREAQLVLPQGELLERDGEIRPLAEWLLEPAPAVIVYGSRGMGKTALARAFLMSVRRPAGWGGGAPDARN